MNKKTKIYGVVASLGVFVVVGGIMIAISHHDTDVSTTAKYVQLFKDANAQKRDVVLVVYGTDDTKNFNKIKSQVYKAKSGEQKQTQNRFLIGTVKFDGKGQFTDLRKQFVKGTLDDNAQLTGRIKLSQNKNLLGGMSLDVNDPVATTAFKPNKRQAQYTTTIVHYVNAGKNWTIADSVEVKQANDKVIVNLLNNRNQ